jgi:hypothetical protein
VRLRPFLGLVSVLALTLASSGAAYAADVVINNGQAPPDPANLIGDTSYQDDDVYVQNVGCPPGWPEGAPDDPCTSPGDPTEVEVAPGARVWELSAHESSAITVTGGTVENSYLRADASSTVTMSGGTVEDELAADGASTITIVGSGFMVDGMPVPYGDLTALTATLTGTLASGDPIDNVFYQGGGSYTGTITLTLPINIGVPALSLEGKLALAVALLGSVVMLKRRGS